VEKTKITANKEREVMEMKNINELREAINRESLRSAWDNGVKEYALELVEILEESIIGGYFDEEDMQSPNLLKEQLLNGASDWTEYSYGGCSFIYDSDIAERLCTPSELKKTRNGERRPNANEEWLDTQARALNQAANMIIRLAK
jgi:hypothetical protein